MKLPTLMVLTDRSQCSGPLIDVVAVAVAAGARAVVLREKDLSEARRVEMADQLRAVLAPVGGVLMIAGARGDAVHLSASDAFPTLRPSFVGRSCHDAGEVRHAGAEGCDYLTASPVFATASKPGYGPALGVHGLAALTTIATAPVYALGGVQPPDVADCLAAGASGVAVMGPVMRTPELVAAYLAALSQGAP
ncbi:thiamine phosphate synthase [uncultured Nocardioides sp.]|uniref:thiamine phosphate synthase n=1 Tax=uncultured Nocardioides sp. TaxID=198441 RepID=UPI0025F3C0A4|nr:thiamine phosphate synthase [uncultured Nocardioides sp.]